MKKIHLKINGLSGLRAVLSTLTVLGAAFPASLPAADRKVVIVRSSTLAPFEQAAQGFKKCLKDKGVAAAVQDVVLPEDPAAAENALRAAAAGKPDLFLAVGTSAAKLVRDKGRSVPSIFCMALDPAADNLLKGGVSMDPRPQDYADYIQRNFPQFKRIGIIHNPLKTKALADAYRAADVSPARFVFEEAPTMGDIQGAIGRLKTKADCLLMVMDSSVYTPQTVPQILLQSIQTSLPFIALSAPFVKGGALAAVYADWGANGCQAADLAAQALQGGDPASLPLMPPRKLSSAVNLIVAGRLGIAVSDQTKAAAQEVVK